MDIFVYAAPEETTSMEVVTSLEGCLGTTRRTWLHSVEQLRARLAEDRSAHCIWVLFVGSAAEFRHLTPVGDLLTGKRVVVVLPRWEEEAVAMGHRLGARFIASLEDEPELLVGVIQQMRRVVQRA